jgi:hypothetical protein
VGSNVPIIDCLETVLDARKQDNGNCETSWEGKAIPALWPKLQTGKNRPANADKLILTSYKKELTAPRAGMINVRATVVSILNMRGPNEGLLVV